MSDPGSSGEGTIEVWQWQDDQNQWRTLSDEESAKLQSHLANSQSGTVIVSHSGIQ